MPTTHWKGPTIPAAGDDLLSAWPTMLDTAVIGTPVDSIAAARVLLATAEASGHAPTPANLAMFLVGSGARRVAYISDGTKSDGVYMMSPLSEIEYTETAYTTGQTITRSGAGLYNRLVTSPLAARPYDRVAIAWGVGTGDVTAGRFNLVARMQGTKDGQLARWDSADAQSSVATMNLARIAAGVDPDINLSTMSAGTGTNTVQMAGSANSTRLIVLAWPITMA